MTSSQRTFTLKEANRTLPLVHRIMQDLVDSYARVQELLSALADAMDASREEEAERLTESLREERTRLEEFASELAPIGCELKGLDPGLVDFRAIHEGRTILLCWKLGEPNISHWHEEADGFLGRQAITPEIAAALGS